MLQGTPGYSPTTHTPGVTIHFYKHDFLWISMQKRLSGFIRWEGRKETSTFLFASTKGTIRKTRREAKMKMSQRKPANNGKNENEQKFLKDNPS